MLTMSRKRDRNGARTMDDERTCCVRTQQQALFDIDAMVKGGNETMGRLWKSVSLSRNQSNMHEGGKRMEEIEKMEGE